MQVSRSIHALEIPFRIPFAPDRFITRSVYLYLIIGERISLIDSCVAGSFRIIADYLRGLGRNQREIATLLLTHSHPDHIGSAQAIRRETGCRVLANALEKAWIEDTQRQKSERPVPGFDQLVEGPVPVDTLLEDGRTLELDRNISCRVLQTPAHSPGSLSLLFPGEKVIICGDALPLPGDMPIYVDLGRSIQTITRIREIADQADTLLSSWEPPGMGRERVQERIVASVDWLRRIHGAVHQAHAEGKKDMELCAAVVQELRLPPFAANPLVARSLQSSLSAGPDITPFATWPEITSGNSETYA